MIQPGTIVPESEFYKLSVVDFEHREWTSLHIDPDKNIQDSGTLCSGSITELVSVSPHNQGKDYLFLEFLHQVDIPFNENTVISKHVAGNEAKSAREMS